MKKILIAILASLFISTGTELHQFIQLPVLINHYDDHKKENNGITFFEFLKIHYGSALPDNKDETNDQRLPFKSAGNINHLDIPVITFSEIIPNELVIPAGRFIIQDKNDNLNQIPHSVFRPPRHSLL